MTDTASKFDDGSGVHTTYWEIVPSHGGSVERSWRAPTGQGDPTVEISDHDPVWDRVRSAARAQYGDPNIDYKIDGGTRYLAFGDGEQLPKDGTLVYHTPQGHNWIAYPGGKYAPADDNFQATAAPFSPAGYKLIDGHYAPINSHGEQIGAQADQLPHPNGWHVHDNIWTPENANGDHYEISDPATGARNYFDRNGHPITQQQYETGNPVPPGQTPDGDPPPPNDGGGTTTVLTDEQNSGAAADAVKKLEAKLQDRNDKSVDADRQLAEVLLNAHATTADGAKRLNDIQNEVETAVNAQPALDTPAGKRNFQQFINGKLKEIADVILLASLDAQSQKDTAAALADAIANQPAISDGTNQPPGNNPGTGNQPGQQITSPPAGSGGGGADGGDLGAGDLGGLGDGDLEDGDLGGLRGLGGLSPLASGLGPALGGLSSIPGAAAGIPATLGGLGSAVPSGIGSMLGGGGLSSPGGGLFDPLRNGHHPDDDPDDDPGDDGGLAGAFGDPSVEPPHDHADDHSGDNSQHHDNNPSGAQQQSPTGNTGSPLPTTAGTGPTPVTLGDGSTVTVDSPELAGAIKDIQAGVNPVDAFRKHNIVLPPTTSPPATPLDPSQLRPGSYGTYSNGDIVVAFGPDKAYVDGRIQPISAAAKPGFLGWQNPPAPVQTTSATAPVPVPVPLPANTTPVR
jgi:hypothetical protein